jgi:hypothetical protein
MLDDVDVFVGKQATDAWPCRNVVIDSDFVVTDCLSSKVGSVLRRLNSQHAEKTRWFPA